MHNIIKSKLKFQITDQSCSANRIDRGKKIACSLDRVGRRTWPVHARRGCDAWPRQERTMISEYGLAATLLIIYEDRNWENIIYLQARQVRSSREALLLVSSSTLPPRADCACDTVLYWIVSWSTVRKLIISPILPLQWLPLFVYQFLTFISTTTQHNTWSTRKKLICIETFLVLQDRYRLPTRSSSSAVYVIE